MKIGYIRVSTEFQSIDRQIDSLKMEGCERIFVDKMSGKNRNRPELQKMLDMLRKDDIVIVHELSRLGRSVKDLIEICEEIDKKNANLISLKEKEIDTTTATGKFMFIVIAAFVSFQRDIIVQQTNEGLKAARKRGRVGGRPKTSEDIINDALRMYDSKSFAISEICKRCNISKSTLYRYVNERNGKNNNQSKNTRKHQ